VYIIYILSKKNNISKVYAKKLFILVLLTTLLIIIKANYTLLDILLTTIITKAL